MSGKHVTYSEVKSFPGKKQTQKDKNTDQLIYTEVRTHPSHSNQAKKTKVKSSEGKGSTVPLAWYLAVVILGTVSFILLLTTVLFAMGVLQGKSGHESKNPPLHNVTQNNCIDQNSANKEESFNKGRESNTCKANWRCCGENCYYFSSDPKNFDESKKFCKERGSSLLKIEDEEELKFIQSQLSYFYWIGLSREGIRSPWTWEDKSLPILKMDWKESSDGNCARLAATNMAAYDCSKVIQFICEKKMAFPPA